MPSNTILTRLAQEPLVHFLCLGALIFGYFAATAAPETAEGGAGITIAAATIERSADGFTERTKRPPTPEELQGLIDELVRDEVLYREALALGLDRDDVVIRRLLRQKFEFVTQDLAVDPEPAADVLRAFYDAHAERYTRAAELSFSQIMFSPDRRGAAAETDATQALQALQAGLGREAADTMGDGGALAPHFDRLADYEIAAIFGPEFAQSVTAQDTGRWIGPIASSYGLHLVWIDSRLPGAVLPFEEVAGQVRDDWTYAQRKEANEGIYRKLLERYDVTIEPLVPAAAEGGS